MHNKLWACSSSAARSAASEVITLSRAYSRPIETKYNIVTASEGRTAEVVRAVKNRSPDCNASEAFDHVKEETLWLQVSHIR